MHGPDGGADPGRLAGLGEHRAQLVLLQRQGEALQRRAQHLGTRQLVLLQPPVHHL